MSGLIKAVDTGVGYQANYHHLAEAHWITGTNHVTLKVAVYKDKDAYLDGYSPVRVDTVEIEDGFGAELYQGVADACIGVLRCQDFYADAEVA